MTTSVADVLAHIERLRAGETLDDERASAILELYQRGGLADYQMSSWLATIAARGLRFEEIVSLTKAYLGPGRHGALGRASGLSGTRGRVLVDKHSTGGVGDKTTLVVVPLVTSLGVQVCKLSGRGLGIAGGTIDKLKGIPGLRLTFTDAEFAKRLGEGHSIMASFSSDLVPGDTATYDLRSASGCVRSIPLIAASIVSKKVAVNADAVIFDVKYGAGTLLPDHGSASQLARLLIRLGNEFGLRCEAVLNDGSQPMGSAVGNAVEVDEAVALLSGSADHCLPVLIEAVAVRMVRVANLDEPEESIRRRLAVAIESGAALAALVRILSSQGADVQPIRDGSGYCRPGARRSVVARHAGWVTDVSSEGIGRASLMLGAGRVFADDVIDADAGVSLIKHVGDRVAEGDVIAEVFRGYGTIDPAVLDLVSGAFSFGGPQECHARQEPELVSESDARSHEAGTVYV